MDRLKHTTKNLIRRKYRVRSTVSGSPDRPRLTVFVSNKNVSAQIIDDTAHKTLASSTSVGQKIEGNMTDKAKSVGADIAKKAKAAKVKQVVFDRNGRLYHGRIKALADAAREAGLEF
ncbi:MAG TPA: 50S ribosomal protein L18 [Patescibacteria group bacterium]|nr:50S ribosomal protein L18 [Patescibacteria group bacterium]